MGRRPNITRSSNMKHNKTTGNRAIAVVARYGLAAMAGMVVVFGHLPQATAQPVFEGWGPSHQYDNGFNPSAAMTGSTVVEVHNATASAGPLWYRVGQVDGSTIQWSNSHQYDNGFNPS